MNRDHDKTKLEAFFRAVARLTSDHREMNLIGRKSEPDGRKSEPDTDEFASVAWVSPHDLGKALEAVDPEWYKPEPRKDKK